MLTSVQAAASRHRELAVPEPEAIASGAFYMYGECMARLISTTIRLDQEDVRALKRARARPERPAVVIVVRRRAFGRQDGSQGPGAARGFPADRPSDAPA